MKSKRSNSFSVSTNQNKNEVEEIQSYFVTLCKQYLDIEPISNKRLNAILIKKALESLAVDQIKLLLDDWMQENRPDEEKIHLSRALSVNHLNTWRLRNQQ